MHVALKDKAIHQLTNKLLPFNKMREIYRSKMALVSVFTVKRRSIFKNNIKGN